MPLPPLPEPEGKGTFETEFGTMEVPCYSQSQMEEYANLAIQQYIQDSRTITLFEE